jgi:hypothetical protein
LPFKCNLHRYTVDLELMGATLDVACGDVTALDANIAATVASLQASAVKVSPLKAAASSSPSAAAAAETAAMEEEHEGPTVSAGAAGALDEAAGKPPKRITTTAVTLIDICVRAHTVMTPVVVGLCTL